MQVRDGKRCADCVYSHRIKDGSLQCRRYPPQGGFARVNDDCFCGEYMRDWTPEEKAAIYGETSVDEQQQGGGELGAHIRKRGRPKKENGAGH